MNEEFIYVAFQFTIAFAIGVSVLAWCYCAREVFRDAIKWRRAQKTKRS